MDFDRLIQAALAVRQHAYAPYSRFSVGAALLAENEEIFLGCNVENLSFGLTLCAERSAVVAAVAAGQTRFRALAIVADTVTPVSPCGACRQVLAEFAPDLPIALATLAGKREIHILTDLFPRAKTGILEKP